MWEKNWRKVRLLQFTLDVLEDVGVAPFCGDAIRGQVLDLV